MESDYSLELLPSLAPPPRLPETTARRRGKVELPPQSVRYPGPIGMIEEHIADAPEGFRQAQESMPDEFEPLTHSDMMGFMKLIDDLKHFIIKLRCGASCQSGSDDANEERQRSRSRSRHRGSDEGEPSHRKRSPEVRRHSRTQRQQPSQTFQGFQTRWPQSQFSQPF
ncbi:uncharacterized protein LOC110696272 isoform X3 [Chenopodium quinoa]|uniref:uncharacterized protein LOC110696272 isoform X3 n=1 Tax=Chenopodium quinoa TaxID=63459 RepID=UPI000B7830F4|nr:uncharacterized protein LOC110696272 isoform X3 [Chenopodium quinoa]